ncbi:alpha/beta hydrolase [Pseudomonas sp. UBA2684]|uniref:alpha/beta hydrolase n=1 Tax=Pseudomonas sp. UBA2684 TaxID=1947311 RepID=UPI000E80FB11|nr:alpha/beta hydrolase fold domain-containing protein [Pseudomonas sp. UBA2684]HBX55666.1 arylesterase [Pseudomonas sp.]
MNVASVVDPELAAMAQVPGFELSLENLPAARDYLLEMLAVPAQALSSAAVAVEERHIPGEGSAPAVRVIIYRPVSAALATPAILEIHGGGFVMGVPEQSDGHNLQLAETLGCVVVAVNYRLAPEASGMAAVDDCYTVLRWLYRDSATIGVDPQRIAVLGDSAGGGIAAGLVLLARDRGEVPIACQVLTYPMLDDRTGSTVDPGDYSGEFSWPRGRAFIGCCNALTLRRPAGRSASGRPCAVVHQAIECFGHFFGRARVVMAYPPEP